jgi:hypothetical protein
MPSPHPEEDHRPELDRKRHGRDSVAAGMCLSAESARCFRGQFTYVTTQASHNNLNVPCKRTKVEVEERYLKAD